MCLYVFKDISVQQYDFLPKTATFFPQINLYSLRIFWSYTMVLLAALQTLYNCLILAI